MLENNKALVNKFFKILSEDKRLPEELLDSGIIYHVPRVPPLDLNAMHQRVALFSSYFSDFKHNEVVIIAEDDQVAFRSKLEGIHTGELMSVAPSNKRFSVVEMGFFRISNGKIVEMWGLLNTYELMQQLGVIKQEK